MSDDEAAVGSNEFPIDLGEEPQQEQDEEQDAISENEPSTHVDVDTDVKDAPVDNDAEATRAYREHMKVLYQLDHPSVSTEDIRKRLSSLHTIEQNVVQALNEASAIITDVRNAPSVDDLKTRFASSDDGDKSDTKNPINNYFRLISDIRRSMRREIIALKAANLLPTNVNAKYEWIAQKQEHDNAIWASSMLDKLTVNQQDNKQETGDIQDVDMQES